MICFKCHGKTKVVRTESYPDSSEVARKRKCTKCGFIFITIEQVTNSSSVKAYLNTTDKQRRNKNDSNK